MKYYSKEPYIEELSHFSRILASDISKLPIDSIKSSGYVVDSLEACLWCFLNNDSYKDTVITAVNLVGTRTPLAPLPADWPAYTTDMKAFPRNGYRRSPKSMK
ncbi:MAG: ADP-ribosylglycohydrolase family protein [Acetomicrobium sp.]|nr:ADP-ribosylglycohydrolase family protein [Acetomicrobium sp.]